MLTAEYSLRSLVPQFRTGVSRVQLRRFAAQLPVCLSVSLVFTALILVAFGDAAHRNWLYLWAAGQIALTAVGFSFRRRRKQPAPDDGPAIVLERVPLRLSIAWGAACGGLWGSLSLLLPHAVDGQTATLIVAIGGMAAVGATTLSAVPQIALAFIVCCCVPVVLHGFVLPGDYPGNLSLPFAVLMVALILVSRAVYRGMFERRLSSRSPDRAEREAFRNRVVGIVNSAEDLETALSESLREICDFAGFDAARVIAKSDDDANRTVPAETIYVSDTVSHKEFRKMLQDPGFDSILSRAVRSVDTGMQHWRLRPGLPEGLESYLVVPVTAGRQTIAILELFSTSRHRPDDGTIQSLTYIAARLGLSIERYIADAELRQSERNFRRLIQNSALGMAVHRHDRILYANDEVARIFGYTADELPGLRSAQDFVYPRFQPMLEQIAQARAAGEPQAGSFEFEGVHKSGRRIPLRGRVDTVEWRGKAALLTSVIDMTEHKAAEQARRREEGRARDYLNITGSIIYAMDVHGNLTLLNSSGCRTLECEERDVLGKNGFDLFTPEKRREHDKAMYARWMSGEEPVLSTTLNSVITTSGRKCYVRWQTVPLTDERGRITGVLGSGEEVTQQIYTERQLRQAQKMEAVGQLTNGIAHDFNNILMVVIGNLELAQNQPKNCAHLISAALNGAQRGADLNRQLLAFSRLQIIDAKVVDINKAVLNMLGLLERSLGERIDIEIMLCDEICRSKLDQGQLESAILNLGVNARDAIKGPGKIVIETGVADKTQFPELEGTDDEMLYVVVRDDGSGMSPEVLKQAFDPFFTTKKAGAGSGLGLSMVFGFIQRSGGNIRIFSTPGKGTSVYLFLPRFDSEEEVAVQETQSMPALPDDEDRTVLLIEDKAEVEETIRGFLTSLGYDVLTARDGEQGVAMIDQCAEDIDLVLSDIVLPGAVSGTDVVEELLASHKGIKAVLMSGNPEKSSDEGSDELPDVPFLRKPFRRSALAKVLRESFHT